MDFDKSFSFGNKSIGAPSNQEESKISPLPSDSKTPNRRYSSFGNALKTQSKNKMRQDVANGVASVVSSHSQQVEEVVVRDENAPVARISGPHRP